MTLSQSQKENIKNKQKQKNNGVVVNGYPLTFTTAFFSCSTKQKLKITLTIR